MLYEEAIKYKNDDSTEAKFLLLKNTMAPMKDWILKPISIQLKRSSAHKNYAVIYVEPRVQRCISENKNYKNG